MKKLLLSVLCLLAVFTAVVPSRGDTINGVLAQERVVNLPNDQGKWYVSVVGNASDAAYRRVLGWFEANAKPEGPQKPGPFLPGHEWHRNLPGTVRPQREGAADRAGAEAGWSRGL